MSTIGVVDLPRPPASSLGAGSFGVVKPLASRRFAGSSLLEWVVRRVTEVQALDNTVVMLGAEQADLQPLAPPNVAVHVLRHDDPLDGLAEVCGAAKADAVVRVSVDTPFVDPVLVDQLIRTAQSSGVDYATYCVCDGRSAIQAKLGLVAEWISASAVRRANQLAGEQERGSCTEFIAGHPEEFTAKLLRLPEPLSRGSLRLAVTSEEDWEHAHQIVEALGHEDLDWQRIAVLLNERPGLGNRSSKLNEAAS